jgi:hypothetical protein
VSWRSRLVGLGLGAALALAATPSARAEWIGDKVRVELRTGPGQRHRILRVVETGERVQKLSEQEGWTQVRAADGAEGWVPQDVLSDQPPAAQRLRRLEQELEGARAKLAEMSAGVASPEADPGGELERLRARVAELEREPAAPAGASLPTRWQTLAMGALILLVGMAIGLVLPRAGVARARKIKF